MPRDGRFIEKVGTYDPRADKAPISLKLDRIELYQFHRPDPHVPFAESVGTFAELRAEGKIRHVGLSNVSLAQVKEAQAIVPIASVQNRFNLLEREDDPVLDYCAQQGIAYLPWGPLAAKPFAPEAPLAKASGLMAQIAGDLQATAGQVALAWLLRRSPNIILIPGTTSIAHLEENIGAGAIRLSEEQFAAVSPPSS